MSRKVLVVDDEKLIVKGLRFSLEQERKHWKKQKQESTISSFLT